MGVEGERVREKCLRYLRVELDGLHNSTKANDPSAWLNAILRAVKNISEMDVD